jgi:hypothetical protein
VAYYTKKKGVSYILTVSFQCEEKTIDVLLQDIKKLNDLLFKTQQKLSDLKKQEEQQHIDIHGLESAKSAVLSHIHRTQKELQCQREIIYNKVSNSAQLTPNNRVLPEWYIAVQKIRICQN